MITIDDLQNILADSFLDGNLAIAGILIYTAVIILVFALTRNTTYALIVSLPATLVCSMLGFLNNDIMILLIIVTILGLAFTNRDIWRA